jgi:excisionase family DNA binding protein
MIIRQPEKPLTYTVEEAAKLLRIGRNKGYEAAKSGELPTVRMGKRILVPRLALERLLARGDQEPAVNRLTLGKKNRDDPTLAARLGE